MSDAGQSRVFRVWTNAFWSQSFALRRLLVMLFVPVPLAALCLAYGQGMIGLLVMAIGCWPFPFRCTVDEHGLSVSWLMVTERLSFEHISTIRVVADPRRGVFGPRRAVLEISRHSGRPMLLFGRPAVLSELYERIADARDSAEATSF